MNESYIGQLHDRAPGELDLADPLHVFERKERPDRALKSMKVECEARYYEGELHAFHALVWRRQAKRCWREQLAFLGRALEHPREPPSRVRGSGLSVGLRPGQKRRGALLEAATARQTKLAREVPNERRPRAERHVGLATFRHLNDLTVEPGDFRARIECANRAHRARAT